MRNGNEIVNPCIKGKVRKIDTDSVGGFLAILEGTKEGKAKWSQPSRTT